MPFEETSRRPRDLRRESWTGWERLYGHGVANSTSSGFPAVPESAAAGLGDGARCRSSVEGEAGVLVEGSARTIQNVTADLKTEALALAVLGRAGIPRVETGASSAAVAAPARFEDRRGDDVRERGAPRGRRCLAQGSDQRRGDGWSDRGPPRRAGRDRAGL
jgi:hypothetical protein